MNWKLFFILFIISIVSSEIPDREITPKETKISKLIRKSRGVNPWGFFTGIFDATRITLEQKNETEHTLRNVYDILADGFNDTYTTTTTRKTPTRINDDTNKSENSTESTTTEKYRVSREQLGRILGRNYLGLRRLFQIELQDALNQSQYTINEFKAYEKMKFSMGKRFNNNTES